MEVALKAKRGPSPVGDGLPGLLRIMTDRGLDDTKVGAMIGKSRRCIQSWRTGEYPVNTKNLKTLAEALEVDFLDLLKA